MSGGPVVVGADGKKRPATEQEMATFKAMATLDKRKHGALAGDGDGDGDAPPVVQQRRPTARRAPPNPKPGASPPTAVALDRDPRYTLARQPILTADAALRAPPPLRDVAHYIGVLTGAVTAGVTCGAPPEWDASAKLELPDDSPWRTTDPWLTRLRSVLLSECPEDVARRREVHAGTCNHVYELSAEALARAEAPAALGSLDVVYRITKSGHAGETYDDAILECATSLAMAAEGVGPPILTALLWPSVDDEGAFDGKWRILVVMKRCATTLHRFAAKVADNSFAALRLDAGGKRNLGEVLGARAVALAARVAKLGVVHFDLKGGNVLAEPNVDNVEATRLYAIDFDPLFCVEPDDAVFGVKARMFVNLLLLATHVAVFLQSPHDSGLNAGFLAAVRWPLMELWLEACDAAELVRAEGRVWMRDAAERGTKFGAGGRMLEGCDLLPCLVEHLLKNNTLRHLDDRSRCPRMLQTMVLEYFFHTDGCEYGSRKSRTRPHPVIDSWRGADGGGWRHGSHADWGGRRGPLVRQLLRFVLFRREEEAELPEMWRAALRYTDP